VRFEEGVVVAPRAGLLPGPGYTLGARLVRKTNLYLVLLDASVEVPVAVEALGRLSHVRYAQPDHRLETRSTTPNDTYWYKQWGLHNIGENPKAFTGWTEDIQSCGGDGCATGPSCEAACGGSPAGGGCYCDSICEASGDCCEDFCSQCPSLCPEVDCYCDASCIPFGDCCANVCDTCGICTGTLDADIDAPWGWDYETDSYTATKAVMAVVDTGFDITHTDLATNIWTNPVDWANGIDDDGNGYVDDIHGWDFVRNDGDPDDQDGHGTHVAGTVAARGDDGYGVVGTAFGARVMTLKFLEGRWGGSTYDAAAAIHYAVNEGAHVINASWSGPGYSTMLRNAINYARSRGVVFVAASGNEGRNNDRVSTYPANYDLANVISVGATDRRDRLASFSNYGSTQVDLAAPGEDIVSTVPGPDWAYMSGTSMAAPCVSGVAALLLGAQPDLGPPALRAALMQTVDPIVGGNSTLLSGGRVNAFAALNAIGAVPPEPGQDNEQEPPADDPTPVEWTFVSFPVPSPHPYGNNFSGWVGVDAPEAATEMRLHFKRIDVEPGYDFVTIKDLGGTQLAQWTGDVGAVVSEPLPARQVTVHLYTDGSVTEWGLEIDGFSWR
jgi:subtilisin family serine protease